MSNVRKSGCKGTNNFPTDQIFRSLILCVLQILSHRSDHGVSRVWIKSLVVIMFLCLNYKHRDTVVVDVIDDANVTGDRFLSHPLEIYAGIF